MKTNRLLLIGTLVGTGIASACSGGSNPSEGGSSRPEIPGVGNGPGFGGPSASGGSNVGTATPGLAPSPGFGGPSGAAGTAASSGGSVTTGLPADQPVSELGAEDVEQLCAGLVERVQRELGAVGLQRLACTVVAVGSASESTPDGAAEPTIDVAACEEAVDECLASPEQVDTVGPVECNPTELLSDFAQCNITVGELEQCLNAGLQLAEQLANLFRCANLADPEALAAMLGSSAMSLPPACTAIQSTCPAVSGMTPIPGEPTTGTAGCTNTCRYPNDGDCDDGGEGAITTICDLGTDCVDCGPR